MYIGKLLSNWNEDKLGAHMQRLGMFGMVKKGPCNEYQRECVLATCNIGEAKALVIAHLCHCSPAELHICTAGSWLYFVPC